MNRHNRDCRFLEDTGRLPDRFDVVKGVKVGLWLVNRRHGAKLGKLSCEQIQLIEDALGVDALVPVIDFERTLAEVAHYTSVHGRVPCRDTGDSHEHRLGQWLAMRRFDYNDGTLSAAHTSRLDSVLGLEWRPKFKSDTVCLVRDES